MDTNVEKPTDVGVSGRSTVLILSVTFVIFLLTVVFGTLWLHERNRPDVVKTVTVEKIREVPVERIKEVPVEKIKEVAPGRRSLSISTFEMSFRSRRGSPNPCK